MTESIALHPEVNKELFAKIRDKIQASPEEHNNWSWENLNAECGTTRCTAGWAIHFQNPKQNIRATVKDLDYPNFTVAGRELLGITPREADYLFYTDNEDSRAMIEHFALHGREKWEFPEGIDD